MLAALKRRLQELSDQTKEAAQAAASSIDKLKVSESEREERLATCKGCEHLFTPTTTCKKCGCFMVAKTWIADSSCPIGKWKTIPIIKDTQ